MGGGEGERGGERKGRGHGKAQFLGTRRDAVEKQLASEGEEGKVQNRLVGHTCNSGNCSICHCLLVWAETVLYR